MSSKTPSSDPKLDQHLVELLFEDELPPEKATALHTALASDPEAQARFEAWQNVLRLTAELPEADPDPQVHYEILRAARTAAAVKTEKKGFWAWLEGFMASPALATAGLLVVAAGSAFFVSRMGDQAPESGSAVEVGYREEAPVQSPPAAKAVSGEQLKSEKTGKKAKIKAPEAERPVAYEWDVDGEQADNEGAFALNDSPAEPLEAKKKGALDQARLEPGSEDPKADGKPLELALKKDALGGLPGQATTAPVPDVEAVLPSGGDANAPSNGLIADTLTEQRPQSETAGDGIVEDGAGMGNPMGNVAGSGALGRKGLSSLGSKGKSKNARGPRASRDDADGRFKQEARAPEDSAERRLTGKGRVERDKEALEDGETRINLGDLTVESNAGGRKTPKGKSATRTSTAQRKAPRKEQTKRRKNKRPSKKLTIGDFRGDAEGEAAVDGLATDETSNRGEFADVPPSVPPADVGGMAVEGTGRGGGGSADANQDRAAPEPFPAQAEEDIATNAAPAKPQRTPPREAQAAERRRNDMAQEDAFDTDDLVQGADVANAEPELPDPVAEPMPEPAPEPVPEPVAVEAPPATAAVAEKAPAPTQAADPPPPPKVQKPRTRRSNAASGYGDVITGVEEAQKVAEAEETAAPPARTDRLAAARNYRAEGKHPLAVQAFNEYISANRGTGVSLGAVYLEIGQSYEAMGDFDRALQMYRLARSQGGAVRGKALKLMKRIESRRAGPQGTSKSQPVAAPSADEINLDAAEPASPKE
ncbi:MAG: hypothetical protein ACE366_02715 [Bradymonadia bacterium]